MRNVITSENGNFALYEHLTYDNHLELLLECSSHADKYGIKVYMLEIKSKVPYKTEYDSNIWISFGNTYNFNINGADSYVNICSEAVEFAKKVRDFIENKWINY